MKRFRFILMEANREKLGRTKDVFVQIPRDIAADWMALTIRVTPIKNGTPEEPVLYKPGIVEQYDSPTYIDLSEQYGIDFQLAYAKATGFRTFEQAMKKLTGVNVRFSKPGKYKIERISDGGISSTEVTVNPSDVENYDGDPFAFAPTSKVETSAQASVPPPAPEAPSVPRNRPSSTASKRAERSERIAERRNPTAAPVPPEDNDNTEPAPPAPEAPVTNNPDDLTSKSKEDQDDIDKIFDESVPPRSEKPAAEKEKSSSTVTEFLNANDDVKLRMLKDMFKTEESRTQLKAMPYDQQEEYEHWLVMQLRRIDYANTHDDLRALYQKLLTYLPKPLERFRQATGDKKLRVLSNISRAELSYYDHMPKTDSDVYRNWLREELKKTSDAAKQKEIEEWLRNLPHAGSVDNTDDEKPAAENKTSDAEIFASEEKTVQYVAEQLQKNPQQIRNMILSGKRLLEGVSDEQRQNETFLRAAVSLDPKSLLLVSPPFNGDKRIVLAAVTKSGSVFEFASDALKDDKDFVRTVVKLHGLALQYASTTLREDKEVVRDAMQQTVHALNYARKLMAQKDFAIEAVRRNWEALLYASDTLKDDTDVVRIAYTQNREALKFASKRIRERGSV